ncbi:MAG: hypothetical protein O2800_00650 [Planctomycetota bacterium]|nr:hypothetical protein [Planctomycetota bacterium]
MSDAPLRRTSTPLWQWVFDGALIMVLVGSLGFFVSRGVPTLRAAHDKTRDTPTHVRMIHRPVWLHEKDIVPLARTIAESLAMGGVNHENLSLAKRGLELSGWFDSVHQIRLDGSTIVIDGDYATPAALVTSGGHDILIGSRGQRMPREYPVGAGPALPRFLGVKDTAPECAGIVWPGASVDAGLSVLALVESRPWHDEIAAIDLSKYPETGSISLLTKGGVKILWGLAPGEEDSAQIPPMQRLAMLDMLAQMHGSLDRTGHRSIDVTLDIAMGR